MGVTFCHKTGTRIFYVYGLQISFFLSDLKKHHLLHFMQLYGCASALSFWELGKRGEICSDNTH